MIMLFRCVFEQQTGCSYFEQLRAAGIHLRAHEFHLLGSTLTIKGERKKEREVNHENYYRCERFHGSIARSLELLAEAKPEQAKATFTSGILEIASR